MQRTRWTLVGLLLVATFLRVYHFTQVGLEHDEVAHWLINRGIEQGKHALYFSEAYGHEAGFHYWQTAFALALGQNSFALRLPAAVMGILSVAVTYPLVRQLYNRRIAMIAVLIVAVTFFPVFYSRLALRAISLPVLSAVSIYFFERAWRRSRFQDYLIAGIFAGLTVHTYMASRMLPIFYLGWFAYLAWTERKRWQTEWRGVALFVALYAVLGLPLLIYLRLYPSAELRVSEVDAPLRALMSGDWRPIWHNITAIFGVFGWSGDPLWRQNVAHRPIFDPLTAMLFYGGLLVALWRHKRSDLFTLWWIATSTIPSIVTVDAPSTIRMINLLPLLGVLPAQLLDLALIRPKRQLIAPLMGILLLLGGWRTFDFHERVWPSADEVKFVWQKSLTEMARYLDQTENRPTQIVGWSAETMDQPTLELALKRTDLSLRFTMADTLLLPLSDKNVRILRPSTPNLPLHPALEKQLENWGATITTFPDFVEYRLPTPTNFPNPQTITLGGELTFLGSTTCQGESAQCDLLTFWRVEARPTAGRRIFLHVLNGAGEVTSQSDGLSAPIWSWQVGDILVQAHSVVLGEDSAEWRVGVYNPEPPYPRLVGSNGRDFIVISGK